MKGKSMNPSCYGPGPSKEVAKELVEKGRVDKKKSLFKRKKQNGKR